MKYFVATDKEKDVLDGYQVDNKAIAFIDSPQGWLLPASILEVPAFAGLAPVLKRMPVIEYEREKPKDAEE